MDEYSSASSRSVMTPGPSQEAAVATAAPSVFQRPLLYDQPLKWFILLSTLDIMLTAVVLHMGGREVNFIAQLFLQHGDLYGLIGFKFVMVVAIILLCDFVGRRDDTRGRFIARMAVVITSLPVILASVQLVAFVHL